MVQIAIRGRVDLLPLQAYVQVLRQQQMIQSMSRPANSYDNASCESFMKTLLRSLALLRN